MATKAYQGPVELNGVTYQVRGPVIRQAVVEWPDPTPVVSDRLRSIRRLSQSWGIDTIRGLLIDRDYAGAFKMAYDSTIETRFQYQLTLPGLWVAEASADCDLVAVHSNDMSVVGGVEFDSEIWVLHGQTVSTVKKLYARRFDETGTPAWDVTEELLTGAAAVYLPHDLKKHGAYLFAVASTGAVRSLLRRPLGSSTWTDMSTTFRAITGVILDDGGVLTDDTTDANSAAANDVQTFPAVPAVSDAIYFGFADPPPNELRVNVGTARIGAATVQWEYFAGMVGTEEQWPMVENLVDGTNAFANSGINTVTFTIPHARRVFAPPGQYMTLYWSSKVIANVSAYWLRCRIITTSISTVPLITQVWSAGMPVTQAANDRTLLLSMGERLFMSVWVAATGVITLRYSDDLGQTFIKATDTITSTLPPTSFVSYSNDDMIDVPHLGTAEGVWRYNLDGENPDLVIPLPVNKWNCKGMAVWAGGLYVPIGAEPLGQLLEFKVQGGLRIHSSVGLNNGAGLPAARQGFFIDMRPAGPWLLGLVRNDSTYECGVFAFDGLGWHHIYDSNTSSGGWATTGTPKPQVMVVSNVDGTDRLHLIWEATSTTIDAAHMKYPLSNPLSISGFAYEDDGYLDLPRYAAALPEHNANWLQSHIDADDLSASTSGEYVAWKFGKDGEARTINSPGNFLSGTKSVKATTTNAGVSSKTLATRLHFYRASTTTNSPKVYSWNVEFLKIPTVRHVWRFLVDIEKSSARGVLTPEDVITNLETVENLVTQATFSIANESQVYVKVLPPSPSWAFETSREPDPFELIPRTGTIEIDLVELIG